LETHDIIFKIEKNIWKSFKEINNIGLYTGLSGYILFYDSIFEAYKLEEFEVKLLEVISRTNELIEFAESTVALSSGMAGYGLALLRLKNKNIDLDEEYLESIDSFLLNDFELLAEAKNYDFMHQSMGIAMYFIERYKTNKNTKIIEILTRFSEKLINEINIDFREVLAQYDENRGKHYSLGLAHGVASYINFLIYLKLNFTELKVAIDKALESCVDFLISYRSYDERSKQYYFNAVSAEIDDYISSRLSWCQGDLGVSNALYNAGVFLSNNDLIDEAKYLMNHSAKLNFDDSGVQDFGICHGSAGVLIQIYLASKKYKVDYDKEINYWLQIVSEQTNNYEDYNWFNNSSNSYFPATNLLVGSVGLGMVLLTVENKITTKWLEVFNLHL
jgi:lantibiotic biosynthesis protein